MIFKITRRYDKWRNIETSSFKIVEKKNLRRKKHGMKIKV